MSLGNVNIEDVPDDVDIFDEIVMIENRFVNFFIFLSYQKKRQESLRI